MLRPRLSQGAGLRFLKVCGTLYEQMANTIRILGLDPGLRRTGWGVIAVEGSRLIHVASLEAYADKILGKRNETLDDSSPDER